MIVVFLSGAPVNTGTTLYVNNILSTLFLPAGSRNQYRYLSGGVRVNIGPQELPVLLKLANRKWRKERVLFVFFDRYAAGGYQFIPLRMGRLISAMNQDSRLSCLIELGDYVRVQHFAGWLADHAADKNFPHLTAGDPNNPDDGYYVFHTKAKPKTLETVEKGHQVWTHLVDALAACARFQQPPNHQFLFIRADLECRRWGSVVPMTPKKGQFRVASDSRFLLKLTYRWPFQTPVPNSNIQLQCTEPLRLDLTQIQIANPGDTVTVNCKTRKFPEDTEMSLGLAAGGNQNVFLPTAPIRFKIGFSFRQILNVVIGVLLVGIGAAISASDYKFVLQGFGEFLRHINLIRASGELCNMVGLMWLFLTFGKKLT
jgi:hypothetical protein